MSDQERCRHGVVHQRSYSLGMNADMIYSEPYNRCSYLRCRENLDEPLFPKGTQSRAPLVKLPGENDYAPPANWYTVVYKGDVRTYCTVRCMTLDQKGRAV